MNNEEEIFCLIGSFLNRLTSNDWCISTNKGIRLQEDGDKILITDKTKSKIIKELSKIYKVEEVKQ